MLSLGCKVPRTLIWPDVNVSKTQLFFNHLISHNIILITKGTVFIYRLMRGGGGVGGLNNFLGKRKEVICRQHSIKGEV